MRPFLAQPALGFPHDESANLLPGRKQIHDRQVETASD
jgi:hypothetical protein